MKSIIIAMVLSFIVILLIEHNFYKYDYVDMNNEIGYSKKCFIADKNDKRPEGLYCKNKKGKIIEVKQYGNRW